MTSIEGTVLQINFRNDENGWTVLELDFDGVLTTAVGCMPHIHDGEFVRLFGAWAEHKVYGPQFVVKSVETRLPNTVESIRMFLSSGLVKGVGFNSWRRIGPVLPAIKVYNQREVDELILLDIMV